jgi:hypothetical protein
MFEIRLAQPQDLQALVAFDHVAWADEERAVLLEYAIRLYDEAP